MAVDPAQYNRVRVGGSGFTAFFFMGKPIAFAEQVSLTTAQPVAPATPIQPMDEPYPVQIITPAAAGPGTMVLQLTELYGHKVWDRLGGDLNYGQGVKHTDNTGVVPGTSTSVSIGNGLLDGLVDIVDVFIKISQQPPGTVEVVKYINPPALFGMDQGSGAYSETYRNCVIANIEDGEQIAVGTMQIVKNITVMYTHTLRNKGLPLALRSRI
jgi:hypothetical protein